MSDITGPWGTSGKKHRDVRQSRKMNKLTTIAWRLPFAALFVFTIWFLYLEAAILPTIAAILSSALNIILGEIDLDVVYVSGNSWKTTTNIVLSVGQTTVSTLNLKHEGVTNPLFIIPITVALAGTVPDRMFRNIVIALIVCAPIGVSLLLLGHLLELFSIIEGSYQTIANDGVISTHRSGIQALPQFRHLHEVMSSLLVFGFPPVLVYLINLRFFRNVQVV